MAHRIKAGKIKRTAEDAKRAEARRDAHRALNEAQHKANMATLSAEGITGRDETVFRRKGFRTRAVRPSKLIRSKRRERSQQNQG